jgi:hypothetical protein
MCRQITHKHAIAGRAQLLCFEKTISIGNAAWKLGVGRADQTRSSPVLVVTALWWMIGQAKAPSGARGCFDLMSALLAKARYESDRPS